MTMAEAVRTALSKYATFSGRARRSEYWYFALFQLLVLVVAALVETVFTGLGSIIWFLTGVVLLIPNISVTVRRLHDVNRSGWWYLIAFVPAIGAIVLLIWACTVGTAGPNHYGADPLAPPRVAVI